MDELHPLSHAALPQSRVARHLEAHRPAQQDLDRVSAQLSGLFSLGSPQVERRRPYAAGARPPATAGEPALRLAQVLDLIEYGVLLVAADGRVQHMNRAARAELALSHPLQVADGLLHLRTPADAAALREAISQAAVRGLRKLLALQGECGPEPVAVVPLAPLPGDDPQHGVALLMARREVCEPLTVEWFARAHHLTMAETAVVKGLCADLTPQQIAQRQGVGLATVRTQIGAIRSKTGAGSIRALLRQVSLLPPLVSVLQPGSALSALRPEALHRGLGEPRSHADRQPGAEARPGAALPV